MLGVTLVPIRTVGSMFWYRSWCCLRRRDRGAERAKSPKYSVNNMYFMVIVVVLAQRAKSRNHGDKCILTLIVGILRQNGPNHLIKLIILIVFFSCIECVPPGNAGVETVPCVRAAAERSR